MKLNGIPESLCLSAKNVPIYCEKENKYNLIYFYRKSIRHHVCMTLLLFYEHIYQLHSVIVTTVTGGSDLVFKLYSYDMYFFGKICDIDSHNLNISGDARRYSYLIGFSVRNASF